MAADVKPKLAVGDAALLGSCPWSGPRIAFEDWPDASARGRGWRAERRRAVSRETPLQILFTSGTTGDPKGVVLTHGNVLASVEPIERGAQPLYALGAAACASVAHLRHAAAEPRLRADDGAVDSAHLHRRGTLREPPGGLAADRDDPARAHQRAGRGAARLGAAEGASGGRRIRG